MNFSYVDAEELFQKDTRSAAEKWLDKEFERRGGLEQGAEPEVILRAIALELAEKITSNQLSL
jgi:hypothetical protein